MIALHTPWCPETRCRSRRAPTRRRRSSSGSCSCRGAADPTTGQIVSADVEAQTEQVLKNVQAILEASGSSLKHVLRCGVYLTDLGEFKKMNAVYERMLDGHRPARTTVQVAALPAPGLKVEIDAVAYLP